MLNLGGIMRINRRLKALIYWIIILGYFFGLFYLWMDYKLKTSEQGQYRENIKINPK